MEIATLTAFISPFLPFLLKLGTKATEKATETAAGKFGEAAWSKAQAVWEKLSPKVEANEVAKQAMIDVANNPKDEDLQASLRVQLKKLLNQDQDLAKAMAQILQEDTSDGTSGIQVIQTVTGDKNVTFEKITDSTVRINIGDRDKK